MTQHALLQNHQYLGELLSSHESDGKLGKRRALSLSNTASAALVHEGTTKELRSLLLAVAKSCLAVEAGGGAAYEARAREATSRLAAYLLRGELPNYLR